MLRITNIIAIQNNTIHCLFNNGLSKKLNIDTIIHKDIFGKDILEKNKVKEVKIGEFGQLYWSLAAYMKDENGNTIPCDYDISPELIFEKGE